MCYILFNYSVNSHLGMGMITLGDRDYGDGIPFPFPCKSECRRRGRISVFFKKVISSDDLKAQFEVSSDITV